MDEPVLWSIAVGVALLFCLITAVLVFLWREHRKLKQQLQTLTAQVQRSHDDLVGLCSAAVVVDKRLASGEIRLQDMLERLSLIQETPFLQIDDEELEQEPSQGYEKAIEKIQQGAEVDDLVKACGLTRDEAVLLLRLHGKR